MGQITFAYTPTWWPEGIPALVQPAEAPREGKSELPSEALLRLVGLLPIPTSAPPTKATERARAAEEASCGKEPATTTARPIAESVDAYSLHICDERPAVDQIAPAMPQIKC